ncbi:unnamed protein product [Effrenium voratum]|uniref:S1 motif domain-containing protein n=1 Tax=Effrenium voratum TaxID=2562239 RepID=A0AA36JEN2_9DINO|nr:unnamed protein product [Effrenium voratum]CAJ1432782.1 unnamed protein product [Effrenium voratum]
MGGWLEGTVEEALDYGLRVRTSSGEGLIYATELEEYLEDARSSYVPGDVVRVRSMGEMEEGLLALTMKPAAPEVSEPWDETEEEASEQDLQIRALRQRLRDFLGVSPNRPLPAEVHGETPFGTLLSVGHPDGGEPGQGLLLGPAEDLRSGQQLQVRLVSVDTHRGVLTVTRSG